MSLQDTPRADRMHIALFGKRNSGKSSLINALTGTPVALVSDTPGTTTDPVSKAIEIAPIGPCMLIDTAGFDDEGQLGAMRVEKTKEVLARTDLAILVVSGADDDFTEEEAFLSTLQKQKTPAIIAINKSDLGTRVPAFAAKYPHCLVSAKDGSGISQLKTLLIQNAPESYELASITAHLVEKGDHVLLVAPQDINAPKGRLILAQVQTIRDLLDNHAVVTIVTAGELEASLKLLKAPPKLIITDSQVFPYVYERCPKESQLTSFSVLMARYKGDIDTFLEGVKALDRLKESDTVLILEACSHNPLDGDIGRIKIPTLLRKKVGQGLKVEVRSGNDIPADLRPYALVIHCGACMFNRRHVLSRIAMCEAAGVPITNYGIILAALGGILPKITVK